MITVHHLENSRSQRVLWLLEELGADYQVERYERNPKTMLAPAALRSIHPLGKSPVITDGDNTVAETGAIVEYLVHRHDGALAPPPDTPERQRYSYWLHYAEGSLMPWLLLKLVFDKLGSRSVPLPMRPLGAVIGAAVKSRFIQPQLKNHFAFLESELATRPWFVGEHLTAADVMMSFPLEAAAARGGLSDGYPHLCDVLERMHARPAYQRALERGGPYQISL